MEIERKFLVKTLPDNLDQYKKLHIEQGYLSIVPEVRVRNKDDKYFMTVKGEGTISRPEYEIQISRDVYTELSSHIHGQLLCKDRYIIPIDNHTGELDVYTNFNNLIVIEVEFDNFQSANDFKAPSWFGKEVTKDKDFKNKNLSKILGEV